MLSQNPQVMQRFMDYLSRDVARDEACMKMVLLTGLSAFSRDPINLILKGPSSIGKSFNVTNTLRFFGAHVWWLGGLSPTALVHEYGILMDSETGEEIHEDWKDTRLEQLLEEKNLDKVKLTAEEKHKVKKLKRKVDLEYREIARRSYYLIDLSGKILVFLEAPHFLTYQMLRPILSHDQRQLTFKFTDKTGKGTLRTKTVVLSGWPAAIFCTSDPKYIEDLATRCFTITPEMSKEKYREANILFMRKKAFPRQPDKELPAFCQYIGELIGFLSARNIEVLTPFGPELAEAFPHTTARDMRDLPHFSALMDMFAVFHAFQRPLLQVDGEDFAILVAMQDFLEAFKLLREFGETTRSGLPAHILKVFHKVMLPLSKEQPEGFRYADLVRKHNETFPENIVSTKTMYRWVGELSSIGYVDTQPDPVAPKYKVVQVLKNPPDVLIDLLRTLTSSFSSEKLKKWWKSLRDVVPLKTNLVIKNFSSLEDLYEKCYTIRDWEEQQKQGETSLNQAPSVERSEETFSEDEREYPQAFLENWKGISPALQEAIEYGFSQMAKRLPNKTTRDDFIFDLQSKGLSKEEAEGLLAKLIDQGPLGYDSEGWLVKS